MPKSKIADGGVSIPLEQVFLGHDVGTGMIYQDANIKVTAVENTPYHFHFGINVRKHKSYAYRFDTPDRVIAFTGDTGPSDAVTELAKGADLLVIPSRTGCKFLQGPDANDDRQWSMATDDSHRAGASSGPGQEEHNP